MKGCSAGTRAKGKVGGRGKEKEEGEEEGVGKQSLRWRCVGEIVLEGAQGGGAVGGDGGWGWGSQGTPSKTRSMSRGSQ